VCAEAVKDVKKASDINKIDLIILNPRGRNIPISPGSLLERTRSDRRLHNNAWHYDLRGCPFFAALLYTLFSLSPLGRSVIVVAMVKIRDGESFESAFRKFKKSCEKAGILSEVKKRESFEKPSVRLKKKSIAARKRAVKKSRKSWGD
jgi:small subunit ribosomal protein S21